MANQEKIFESVLANSKDISGKYYNDFALLDELSDNPVSFKNLLDGTRERMNTNGGIGKISAIAPEAIERIDEAHNAGRIAAVDGTDAISPTEVCSKTVYAAGVISTTALTLHDPRIRMTESHRQIPAIADDDDFFDFVDRLESWVDQSWIRTFREYCERIEALRLITDEDMSLVLIDGPLYTQNLLTQPKGRHGVLDDMQRYPDRLIGFIKNLHESKVMFLAGMALQPDEYWTVKNWRDLLAKRFENREWTSKMRSDWVRTIYRKNAKAYAFECHPDLVETGLALIHSPIACSTIVNHEIPFLLHCADRIVQARLAAGAKRENLISASPYYPNLANERTFR